MIKMEALARQNYNGRAYVLGDEISVANEADARDMEVLCFAKRLPEKAALSAHAVVTREASASDGSADVADCEAKKTVEVVGSDARRGKYRQREMSAKR